MVEYWEVRAGFTLVTIFVTGDTRSRALDSV
jgi:hypothetical protein